MGRHERPVVAVGGLTTSILQYGVRSTNVPGLCRITAAKCCSSTSSFYTENIAEGKGDLHMADGEPNRQHNFTHKFHVRIATL